MDFFSGIGNAVGGALSDFGAGIGSVLDGVGSGFSNVASGLGFNGSAMAGAGAGAGAAASGAANSVAGAGSSVANSATDATKGLGFSDMDFEDQIGTLGDIANIGLTGWNAYKVNDRLDTQMENNATMANNAIQREEYNNKVKRSLGEGLAGRKPAAVGAQPVYGRAKS